MKIVETRGVLAASSATKRVKNDDGSAPPRATDPGWAHGVMIDGERHKVKYNYCQKVVVGGGITRLKEHLAGVRGNIAPCVEVPEDVHLEFKRLLGLKSSEKGMRHIGQETSYDKSYASYNENGNGDYDAGKMGQKNDVDASIRPKKQKNSSDQMTIVHSGEPLSRSFNLKEEALRYEFKSGFSHFFKLLQS